MHLVLDPPMTPRQLQQAARRPRRRRQARDREKGLPGLLGSDPADSLDHAHLLQARPVQILSKSRTAPQPPVLHTPMPLTHLPRHVIHRSTLAPLPGAKKLG